MTAYYTGIINCLIRNGFLAGSAAAILTLSFPTSCTARNHLQLWVHPYLPATEIVQRFEPLTTYLSEELGLGVTVKVSRDYEDHIQRVGSGDADIAYMGPMSYVRLTNRFGPQNILSGLEVKGKLTFSGVIIVHKDSALHSLADLKNKRFAFGDPSSTMSHYLPRFMLLKAGVPRELLGQYEHLNSHDDVALAVIGGYFDAGGVMEDVFEKYRDRGLKILARSLPMPEHLFVAGKHLPPEIAQTLRSALLEIDTRDIGILTSIKEGSTGLRSVSDSDYEILRSILKMLDLEGSP